MFWIDVGLGAYVVFLRCEETDCNDDEIDYRGEVRVLMGPQTDVF